jgi:phosphatidylglycerophosphatase A
MQQENFSPEQSLQLIQSMISKTKQDMSDNSIYFLVWGWLTFFASTGQFILKHLLNYEKHYLVWMVVIIGIVFSIYQGRKEEKNSRVKTYVDESMGHLWLGLAISFFVLAVILTKLGWGTMAFPFFIMLYGLGTFVSGSIIRFRPLIIGGIIAWALAIGSTFVSYDYQMLFGAAAILISYIMPAYMLRSRNKTANK